MQANLGHCVSAPHQALQPALEVGPTGEHVRLAAVAARMGKYKIVCQVSGVLRKRHEVVYIKGRHAVATVEAIYSVDTPQALAE